MALDFKPAFATSTAITATGLASLAQNTAYELAAVDNSSNRYDEADIYVALKLQTGTPGSDLAIFVYMYFSEDGTNYIGNATGSAASITLRNPHGFRALGVLPTPDAGGLTYKEVFATSNVIRRLPRKWGLIFFNRTNITFSATGSDHTVTYSGRYATAVIS